MYLDITCQVLFLPSLPIALRLGISTTGNFYGLVTRRLPR